MKKEQLIKRARKWHEDSKKMPLMGYPRQHQEEMTKLSIAIIEAICESENVTPFMAKQSLGMAMDIIDKEMQFAPISDSNGENDSLTTREQTEDTTLIQVVPKKDSHKQNPLSVIAFIMAIIALVKNVIMQ